MENKKNLIVKYDGSDEYAIQYSTIGEFLSSDFIKEIPTYQRPYSWDKIQVNQLIDDVLASVENKKEWFIGPIFTSYVKQKDSIRELLDGQQRITTIILILRVFYFAEYLVSEEIWLSPEFSVPNSMNDDESKRLFFEEQKQKYFGQFANFKKAIHQLLLSTSTKGGYRDGNPPESKFRTAVSSRAAVSGFIEAIIEINSKSDWERNNFVRVSSAQDFEPTLKSINENLQEIQNRIKKILVENNKPIQDGLVDLLDFAESLLNLTFLEIPLNSKEDILDIFESINNRGKKLSLSDIIRFRSLKEYAYDSHIQDEIGKKWNDIFKYSGKLSSGNGSSKFFNSLDVFLERFINALSLENNGYTEQNDRIARFCEYYSSNNLTIKDGVEQLLLTLKKWDFILNGGLAAKGEWGRNRQNVTSIVHLIQLSLVISENSQVMFISFLRNTVSDDFENRGVNDGIPHFLTLILKTTFAISVLNNLPANAARTKYIWIARSFDKSLMPSGKIKYPEGPYLYDKFKLKYQEEPGNPNSEINVMRDVPEINEYNPNIQNILWVDRGNRNLAELILGIYQLCCGKIIPDSNSYKWRNLDHIMPEKWFKNGGWLSINRKNILDEAIMKMSNDKLKVCLLSLNEDEQFYSDSTWANSFIQLIGNKALLYDSTNRDKSNSFWHEHQDNQHNSAQGVRKFLETNFKQNFGKAYVMPEGPNLLYDYDDFTIETIVIRTEIIVGTILTDFACLNVPVK